MRAVTVAVCVYNGESMIERCLNSILALDYPANLLDILVVDNASTDSTFELIKTFPVRVVQEPHKGRGWARNKAQIEAIHSIIAFTDADCMVDSNWLKELIPPFDDDRIGIVSGRIDWDGDDDITRYQKLRQTLSNEEFSGDYPFSPPFAATANAAFRVDLLRSCGGFSEKYDIEEDAAMCWKIQRMGYGLQYCPSAIVHHRHPMSAYQFLHHQTLYGYGGVHLFADFFPQQTYWIWWGLYVRLFLSVLKLPFAILIPDRFARKLPFFDILRDAGLIIGRLRAAVHFRIWVL